jgi:hypothetical protein
VHAWVCELKAPVSVAGASLLKKMAGFMRSVVWQFWAAVLLLSDMLVHLVRAATLEENSNYQACVANPSGCTSLCASSSSFLVAHAWFLFLYGCRG